MGYLLIARETWGSKRSGAWLPRRAPVFARLFTRPASGWRGWISEAADRRPVRARYRETNVAMRNCQCGVSASSMGRLVRVQSLATPESETTCTRCQGKATRRGAGVMRGVDRVVQERAVTLGSIGPVAARWSPDSH